MANGAFDLTGWRIMTAEDVAKLEEEYRLQREEELKRWPMSQRRPRCLNCGAFMPQKSYRHTHCKCCGESYDSLQ